MLEKLQNGQKLIILQTALSAHHMGSLTNLKCYFLFESLFFYISFWQGEKGFMTVYTSVTLHPLGKGRAERELRADTWKQDLKQKPWRHTAFWLAPPHLLSVPLPTLGYHYPQWAGPSYVNYIYHENALQTCLQADII